MCGAAEAYFVIVESRQFARLAVLVATPQMSDSASIILLDALQ